MSNESGLTANELIAETTKSVHGKLELYEPTLRRAAKEQSELLAHLIAYNQVHGQIRDSKVAFPVLSLTAPINGEFRDNALAHLALLDPRMFLQALKFARQVKTPGHGMALRRLVTAYLRAREANPGWWEATVIQHRASMERLYWQYSVKPGTDYMNVVLYGQHYDKTKGAPPEGSVWHDIATLKNKQTMDAAATIIKRRLPYLILSRALGKRLAEETPLKLALIESMTATELVTNTKLLEKLGVRAIPELRAAYEAGLVKVAESGKVTFKTTTAAAAQTDKALAAKLHAAQEKQIAKLGGPKGNWLVLGDKSSSMQQAIEAARIVAATLAKTVDGEVWLIYFDTSPRLINAKGKSYEELLGETRHVTASGATSIGCGMQYALDHGWDVDGIAVVSDGAENSPPFFTPGYERLCERLKKEVPVYLYWMRCWQPSYPGGNNDPGTFRRLMTQRGHDVQVFDLTVGVDYYSLPGIIATMQANRYGLVDQVMSTPLLKLEDVLKAA